MTITEVRSMKLLQVNGTLVLVSHPGLPLRWRSGCNVRRSRFVRCAFVSHRTCSGQCLLDPGRLALKRGHCSSQHRMNPNTRSVCRKVYEYSQSPGIPCICMYIQYDAYRRIQCSHIPTVSFTTLSDRIQSQAKDIPSDLTS